MSILDTLITDRTASDVANRTTKGHYNAADLNRVTAAMEYLDTELRKAGYESGYVPIALREPPEQLYDRNTLLLLHGEELVDSSVYNVPLVNNGVQVSTDQSKFGDKSLYFDGASTISIDVLSEEEMTLDCWVYIDNASISSFPTPFVYKADSYRGIYMHTTSSGTYYGVTLENGSLSSEVGQVITPERWTHIAVIRYGSTVKFYVDGVLQKTKEGVIPKNTVLVFGFADDAPSVSYFSGYMDEIRVSNIVRWESDFTPSDSPYKVEPDSPELGTYEWSKVEEPTRTQMEQYLENVQKIRSSLSAFKSTPLTPDSMRFFNYAKANDIEKILIDVEVMLTNTLKTVDLGWALGTTHIGLYGGF